MSQQTGIVRSMSNEAYHASEGLNNSTLSSMTDSPAHCYALHIDPARPKREATPAMLAGTLAHCAILEPDELPSRYYIRPDGIDGRTKEGKALLALIPPSLTVITTAQFDTAQAQRRAIMTTPELLQVFSTGAAEQSVFWRDQATHLLCKCRPDWVHTLPDGRVILVDVKTTTDASPGAFAKTVWNYGYHRQAAHYSTGWEAATGQEVAAFVFAVVTNGYPILAAAHMLDEDYQRLGADECRKLIDAYADCKRAGKWPGFVGMNLLTPPAWARKTEDELDVSYV